MIRVLEDVSNSKKEEQSDAIPCRALITKTDLSLYGHWERSGWGVSRSRSAESSRPATALH